MAEDECDACELMGSVKSVLSGLMHSKFNRSPTSPAVEQEAKQTSQDEYWEMREPPDIIELGNSGWTLLHSIAAYYPTNPSPEKKKQVQTFLESMSQVNFVISSP